MGMKLGARNTYSLVPRRISGYDLVKISKTILVIRIHDPEHLIKPSALVDQVPLSRISSFIDFPFHIEVRRISTYLKIAIHRWGFVLSPK
jgi:hypothetical protein